MKIFSIQSSKGLVIWGTIFGFIANLLISYILSVQNIASEITEGCGFYHGWPLSSPYGCGDNYIRYFFLNFIFWDLVFLILFSVIRYFKNKQSKPNI